MPEFVTPAAEAKLISAIDKGPWDQTYTRRRKHFGADYRRDFITGQRGIYPGPLPDWLDAIARLLQVSGHFKSIPKHSLINEYLPGQGIADHIDADGAKPMRVASLSLGSGADMRFTHPDGRRHNMYLEPRSLIVFDGELAQFWSHGIPARLADKQGGMVIERKRRISLTFREDA